jgi:protein-disulfide isomerase
VPKHPANTTENGMGGNRQQARERARLEAARVQRKRRITQGIVVGVVALLAIGIVASAVLLGRAGRSERVPTAATNVTIGGASVPFGVDGSAVQVGKADAKVTMDLWVDYSCPHCQEFEATNNDTLTSLVAAGDVAVTYHNIQIVTDYGTEAGSASACMAVHDPNAWPAFNAALYANHTADTDSWTASDFKQFAAANGAGSATQSCIEGGTYKSWITDNTNASTRVGVTGTPTMFIDGQKTDTLSGQALTDRVHQLAAA